MSDQVKTYTTVQGDMWDGIAKKTLGSEYRMTDLIEANLEHKETVIFPSGVRLNIPALDLPIATQLPPWKRG